MGEGGGGVLFDSLSLNLGTILEDDTAAHRVVFRFANTGTETVTIEKAMATCGCTKVVYWPRKAVAAGARDSVVVDYKSNRFPGTIDEPIFLYCDRDDLNPLAKLRVLGKVVETADSRWSHLPATMGPLRLKRKEQTFGENDRVLRIPCANTSAVPLRPRALLLPPYATFAADPQEIKPGEEADLVIRIDRTKLPATRPLRAAITLEGVPADINERKITLIIK